MTLLFCDKRPWNVLKNLPPLFKIDIQYKDVIILRYSFQKYQCFSFKYTVYPYFFFKFSGEDMVSEQENEVAKFKRKGVAFGRGVTWRDIAQQIKSVRGRGWDYQ